MDRRAPVVVKIVVSMAVVAACTSSAGSGTGDVPGVPPADPSTTSAQPSTEPVSSTPAATDAPPATDATTDPATTDPATTEPTDPPTTDDAGTPPTDGVTVVHAGSDFGGAWTPLAIWDGSEWQATYDGDGDVAVPDSSFATVTAVSLGLPAPVTGLAYGGPPDFFCVDDRTGPLLDIGATVGPLAIDSGYNVAAVANDWDVQPRPVEQVGLDAEVYQTTGAAIVSAAGVDPTGGDVVQVVRADLDGNGVDEVLVTFEKVTEGFGTVGDFSVIYVRYPTADGAVDDEVLFEYYPEGGDFPSLGSASLLAVADLNGDVVMEVVTTSQFWESHIIELYELRDGRLEPVADAGCSL